MTEKKFVHSHSTWLFAIVMLFFIQQQASAQGNIWIDIAEPSIEMTGQRGCIPEHYRTLRLDREGMRELLATAPQESLNDQSRGNTGLLFTLPMPDGSTTDFRIFETFVMHPELAAKFPEIKTYAGQGVTDAGATIRVDFTPHGFHAMILSSKGNIFIDPYCKDNSTDYICYDKKDLNRPNTFVCENSNDDPFSHRGIVPSDATGQKSSGATLRTYRLALACTGEYAATKGGTVAGALAGMTTTVNRVNGVFEKEVSVRLVLVANNNLIIYTNAATDPYSNFNGGSMLSENQTTCDGIIGTANYDIGHVFSTGGGGVAFLGCICLPSAKAGGVTGLTNPVGDAFDIDYVAHEIGHQHGGNHTFNSITSNCGGGNRAANSAYEPGSGITIMAYSGICGTDDLATHSIAYFHSRSYDEIVNYTTAGMGSLCGTVTASGNTPPAITSQGINCPIPISTPFVLTGAGSDANGDSITYSWDQMDLGVGGAWNANLSSAPLFRTFPPTNTPTRTFPKLSDIINNTTTIGEILPNVARTMHFRLTARDNKFNGGGVMHPDTTVTITVVNSGGPFAVTSPNTLVTYAGGSTQTVSWSVNGTNTSPINCVNVKISLSTDGGNTYPTVILASTTNDGTESVTIPNIASTMARIKVEAVENIFFDLSDANFIITASAGMSTITTNVVTPTSFCAGSTVSVPFTINSAATSGNVFTAQLSNSAGSFAAPVNIGTMTSTTAGTIAAIIPAGTTAGTGYRIRVISSSPVITGTSNVSNITVSAGLAAAGIINGLNSFCAWLPVTFNVGAITNATNYTWAVPAGATITNGQGSTQITVAFTNVVTTGNITVYGSNATCTGPAATLPINILATPAIPTTSSISGCSGSPITLTGIPAGGTWSVPNPYTGPSTSFYYTVTNNNTGCSAASTLASPAATITINPLPVVTAVNVSGCAGTPINLSGTPAGGTWSVANPYTGNSISYTHTFTDANGCSKTSTPAIVTVNPLPIVTAANVSGCAGTAINLSGTPAGGTWSVVNPYTGNSVAYTHTYTDVNGCSKTSTPAIVTVNPLPVVSFSGLAPGYLAGASVSTLTGSPASGVFSGTGILGNTFSPLLAGVGGPYNITYSYTDANNCSKAVTQQTTVTSTTCATPAVPVAISAPGGNSVCPGESRTYTIAAVAGATTYNWFPPVGATIISGQGTVSVVVNYNAGFVTGDSIRVNASNPCGTSLEKTIKIFRNNPYTPGGITGDLFGLCNKSAIPFSVPNVVGVTFNWTFNVNNATIASGQGSNMITANFGPSFTIGAINVTASNGCGTSQKRTLTVRATPAIPVVITGATSVCANQFGVPYSIVPVANVSNYTWTCPNKARISDGVVTSNNTLLNTTSSAVTVNYGSSTGLVRVRGENACGSGGYNTISITFVCREHDPSNSELAVTCYPQPAKDLLNVSFSTAEATACKLILSDITGKNVQQMSSETNVGENNFNLDVSGIAKGIYMLEVVNGSERNMQKIIVQ